MQLGRELPQFGGTCWPDFLDILSMRHKITPKLRYLSINYTNSHHKIQQTQNSTHRNPSLYGKAKCQQLHYIPTKGRLFCGKVNSTSWYLPGVLNGTTEANGDQKIRSTYLYERGTSHNESNLYITQQVTVYRHMYKGLSSYDKASERKVRIIWI